MIGVLVMALLLAGCTGNRPPGSGDAASTHPVTSAAATAAPVDIDAATVRSGAAEDRIGRSRIEHLEVDGATVVAPVDRGTDRWQLRRSTDAGRTWTESSVQGLAGIDATMIGADVRLLAHRPGQWLLLLHDPADASSRYTVATSADGAVFRVVGSRLDVRADETVERVLGTRSGWVLVTSAVRADRPDLLRTRRSADGGHWDGAVEIRPTVDDFILTVAAATTDRIALGGVTVRGPLADGVFRGAIVTSTGGTAPGQPGRRLRPGGRSAVRRRHPGRERGGESPGPRRADGVGAVPRGHGHP
ncbi:hypothetical protein GCM10011512_06670 [Tersicoccus solisilvae]|uniref:Exo-alpha-sialidase n=1 Tax=Tersicoccus solisilvae TaxID=1882339 RepID=A0ABQ1NQ02_9MICC|nr:hypothetical protein GCM10011512_06670 [Tersicoccus solisilvae]